jgi:hypothetical protein
VWCSAGLNIRPITFLLYVNDICNVSSIFHFVLFVDDTNLFYSHKNISDLIDQVNRELNKLSNWFSANRLSINLKKTNFMIFRPKQKQCDVEFNIFLNSHRVCLINEVGFLGVILDEHLTWKPHISHVARKMSKSIGIIKSKFLSFKIIVENAILCSCLSIYLQYCILIWGSTYSSNLKLYKKNIKIYFGYRNNIYIVVLLFFWLFF